MTIVLNNDLVQDAKGRGLRFFFNERSDQGDQDMKFKSLAVLFAALFLVAACESTSTESGNAGGDGKMMKKGKKKAPPRGFAISPGSAQDLVVNVGDRVFYALNKSNLSAAARTTLEKQAAWLKKFGAVKITVEGHADERGTREYNLALGDRRAVAVRDYLLAKGLNAARVRTVSYGKERPAVSGSTEGSWEFNRRAATVLN